MKGHIYNLQFVDTEFRAPGMHVAPSLERELRKVIKEVLERHPEVIGIDRGPYVRVKSSNKNFAPKGAA